MKKKRIAAAAGLLMLTTSDLPAEPEAFVCPRPMATAPSPANVSHNTASPRQALLHAIRIGTDHHIERPFDNPQVAESVGELVGLMGDRYLAREQSVELPRFHNWRALEQVRVSYGAWESLDIALYQKDDARVAVILGIKGSALEFAKEGAFLRLGDDIPQSYHDAFNVLGRWQEQHDMDAVFGHSKGATIASMYGALTGTPTIALEPFTSDSVIYAFRRAGCHNPLSSAQILNLDSAYTPWPDGVTSRQDIIGVTRPIDTSRANNFMHGHDARFIRGEFDRIRVRFGTDPQSLRPMLPVPPQNYLMRLVNGFESPWPPFAGLTLLTIGAITARRKYRRRSQRLSTPTERRHDLPTSRPGA